MTPTEPQPDRPPGDYLEGETPAHLFVVGDLAETGLQAPLAGKQVHRFSSLPEAQAQASELRSDASVPEDTPHVLVLILTLPHSDLQVLLGRSIRAFPQCVLVHCKAVDGSDSELDERFFALGFHRLTAGPDGLYSNADDCWFEYRLSQYKRAPDWLNARFWANPERFDQEDDPDIYCEESDDEEE